MSLATDKKRWDDLHAAYAKAGEAANEYDRQLSRKYGNTYQPSWLKKGDRDKLDALRARADKIGDKIVELLVKISPRDWMSGVPAHWIRSELTWEDAIRPKGEPLSVAPPTAWGSNTPIQEEAPMTRRESPDAEAAGAEYAAEQLGAPEGHGQGGTFFMDWVRSQLIEASRMDPSTVLPLETEADARVIARNMLKQLEWDTKRDLEPREIADLIGVDSTTHEDVKEFFKGFSDTLRMNDAWLADELLEINREMRGGGVEEALHEGGKQATKPGKHGTLRLWRIAYTDSNDPGFGEHSYQRWAYDKQAAWDDFNEEVNSAGESWEIVKIEPVLDTGPKRLSRETRENMHPPQRQGGVGKARTISPRGRKQAILTGDRIEAIEDLQRAVALGNPAVLTKALAHARRLGVPESTIRSLTGKGMGEARRAQPLVDTKLYSVTWAGGRQGNLTDREAVNLVRQLRNDWVEAGRRGQLNIQVWYRDGSLVPYADLERQFYPTGSPVPGRVGFTSETRRSGRPTPVEDPEYVIQGAYRDGRITESFGFDDEDTARSEAWKLSKSPYFEGDYVRIITRDGELVWDSRGKGEMREPRRGARPTPTTGALAGMSYEQIQSLAHSLAWSPARDEAQRYLETHSSADPDEERGMRRMRYEDREAPRAHKAARRARGVPERATRRHRRR